MAEGFVKSNGDKSLEEVAEDFLKALVETNLFCLALDPEWRSSKQKNEIYLRLCVMRVVSLEENLSSRNVMSTKAASFIGKT